MPEWCPRCNAMLPEGLEKCPRCGKKLNSTSDTKNSMKDIFRISAYVLVVTLIPVIVIIMVGLICVNLGN